MLKSYKVANSVLPFFNGGKVAIEDQKMYTTMDENIVVTDTITNICSSIETDDQVVNLVVCGAYIVSAQRNNKICIWRCSDAANYKLVQSLKGHEAPVICFDYCKNYNLMVSGSADSTIKVWEMEHFQCVNYFKGHTGLITAVKIHPTLPVLYSADSSGKILVHSLEKKKCIATLSSHSSVVKVLLFINDNTLISIGRDQVINVWDLKTFSLLTSFPIYDSIEGGGFLSGNSGVFLHTSGQKGELKLWKMDGLQFQQVQCINVCRDGIIDVIGTKNDISVVTVDHNIHAFTFNNNEILSSNGVRCGFNDELFDIKYSENNFVVATNSNFLKHYDSKTLACQLMIGHTDTVLCLDTIGNLCCSGSKDNTAIIWKLIDSKYEMQCVLKGHTASITSVVMTENFILTCSDDRTMKKWSLTSNLTISPECESTTLVHSKQITSATISPNRKMIATASHDKLIKLWNAHDCSLIGTLKGHSRGVNSVQFSPVEMCLVSCGSDALIKIWSIKDQTCIKTFEGHLNSVIDVKFIKSGTALLSCGGDGLIKTWSIKSGICDESYDEHDDKIWNLALSEDQKEFISVGVDSKILIWKDCSEENKLVQEEEEEKKIQMDNDLAIFLQRGDYVSAMKIALECGKPFRLVNIIKNVRDLEESLSTLVRFVHSLDSNQTCTLWKFIRDWNTSAKYCQTAQLILNILLKHISIDNICEMEDAKEIVEALIAYTEKHMGRAKKLGITSNLVGYTVEMMEGL